MKGRDTAQVSSSYEAELGTSQTHHPKNAAGVASLIFCFIPLLVLNHFFYFSRLICVLKISLLHTELPLQNTAIQSDGIISFVCGRLRTILMPFQVTSWLFSMKFYIELAWSYWKNLFQRTVEEIKQGVTE